MTGPKKKVKVAKFLPKWLEMSIDGHKVSRWLTPDPADPAKGVCLLCPAPNSFSINEGWKSITQHNSGVKHQKNMELSMKNPEFKQVDNSAPKITDGLKKMFELQKDKTANKESVLKSQVCYTASMMYHGAGRNFIDCHAEMVPHLFPDSKIAKKYDIRRTKLGYFATHGIYPYFHSKLVKNLQDRHYSVNFDESTVNGDSQLDINVSYLTPERLVEKRCLTTVALQHGTTGKEIALAVLQELKSRNIDPLMMMSVSTDGCSAMIGVLQGAQTHLRDIIPTLPAWGGCVDHDLANLLKSSVSKLCPELTSIFSALHGTLNKHSMHKKRKYEAMAEWIGMEIKKVPKFLSVRFRVIQACCKWLESQDRGVYLYFKKMKQDVLNKKYEASDTEMIVLEKYLGKYLEVKLSTKFILDVCEPVMELISFFESEKVRIQDRHKKLVTLFNNFYGKFMKNAGCEEGSEMNNNSSVEDILKVKYDDRSKQLSDEEIFLGPKVESLLTELGLRRTSPEIKNWFLNVREFYQEACYKMKKYFKASIRSSTLKALAVLSPKAWVTLDLDTLKKNWLVLGEKFSNVIDMVELPALLSEVSLLKFEKGLVKCADSTVDVFFSSLSKEMDEDGVIKYPFLCKLGSALSTLYNSSSPAERDFSLMNLILGDLRKNRTSQLLLLAKMFITAEIRSLARDCAKCKESLRKGEQSSHCHCELWVPNEALLATMRDGQPYRRYKKDLEEAKKENESLAVLKEIEAGADKEVETADMLDEVGLLRGRVSEIAARKEKEKKEKKIEKEKKGKEIEKGHKAGKKRKGEQSQAEKRRELKRRRLGEGGN